DLAEILLLTRGGSRQAEERDARGGDELHGGLLTAHYSPSHVRCTSDRTDLNHEGHETGSVSARKPRKRNRVWFRVFCAVGFVFVPVVVIVVSTCTRRRGRRRRRSTSNPAAASAGRRGR